MRAMLLLLIAGCALVAPHTRDVSAAQTVDSPPPFETRLRDYLRLRQELAAKFGPVGPVASARELQDRQHMRAEAVRSARLSGAQARLVPEPTVERIRETLRGFFRNRHDSGEPIDLLPSGHPPLVNARYPNFTPLSTIPPQLIERLPALPEPLQYRFHGDYLIVLDAELSLVLDLIADALPPYGTTAVTERPAAPSEPRVLDARTDSVRFAAVGDTGTGGRAQRQIAAQLFAARTRFPYEFIVMLGDNLYGDEDPEDYVEKFEEPYAALLDADLPFYAALGNHDEPSQVFYEPFNMNGQRYYTVSKGNDLVELFVLDSTYMSPAQIAWLKRSLAASTARWKIAALHHPIYSTGRRHGASEELREQLEPLFVGGGVDLVLTGHEHFYERLRPTEGIYYITTGSAAKLRRYGVGGGPETAASYDTGFSFVLLEATREALLFEAVNADGRIVDSGRLPHLAPCEAAATVKGGQPCRAP